MLYILAVLPVALVWGTGLGVVTSILSIAVFDYLFLLPTHSIRVADSRELAALGVFLVTAVVMGELAARSRRVALESARLSQEQSALRRVATLVARSGPPPVVFEAVTGRSACCATPTWRGWSATRPTGPSLGWPCGAGYRWSWPWGRGSTWMA